MIDYFFPGQSTRFLVKVGGSTSTSAREGLLKRDRFTLSDNGNSQTQPIVIEGTSGVAAASGFYYYLKNKCNVSVTWGVNGSGLRTTSLPSVLPPIGSSHITQEAATPLRYYMNVCTVSYSSAWWSKQRWLEEVYWMALHGYNFILSFTGQELVWHKLYTSLGLTEAEIQDWLSGPAFLAWQRMGNLRGWAGPLTEHWINEQAELQKFILAQQAAFGMLPVTPGFSGHVPAALAKKYPSAKFVQSPNWWSAPPQYCCDYLLEPSDPLYLTLGKQFYQLYNETFGVESNFANADTFNEMDPSSSNTTYLRESGVAVQRALAAFNPDGIWVAQGWLFQQSSFWTPAAIKAYLSGVPNDRMMILDLYSELFPIFHRSDNYFGKPWIWCMLHDFGGNRAWQGNMTHIAQQPIIDRLSTNSTMIGLGLTMEAIEQNPVMYELMSDMSWRPDEPIDVDDWLEGWVHSRYSGSSLPELVRAWQNLIRPSFYSQPCPWHSKAVSIMAPPLEPVFPNGPCNQDSTLLSEALDVFVATLVEESLTSAPDSSSSSSLTGPFRYDLVDLTRQCLQNAFRDLHTLFCTEYARWAASPSSTDLAESVISVAERLLRLLDALQGILSADENYLIGNWVSSARALGANEQESDQNQFNALNQITLWGPQGEIRDYAAKEWSLFDTWYFGRWQFLFNQVLSALKAQRPLNQTLLDEQQLAWEEQWNWHNNQTVWPVVPNSGLREAVISARDLLHVSPSTYDELKNTDLPLASNSLSAQATWSRFPPLMKFICDSTVECIGFNSNGLLKTGSVNGALRPAKDVSLFLKK